MIRGVLFDMDGVLLDTETLGYEIMRRNAAQLGYVVDLPLYQSTLGVPSNECDPFYHAKLGQDFPYELAMERFHADLAAYSRDHMPPRKPGLAECLAGLRQRGVRIALATSTMRPLVTHYFDSMPDLAPFFDAMVCGGDVSNGKPEPDIYLAAARAVGCAPEECIGVEDSLSGVRAVRASGARCVMIPDLLPFDGRFAPYVDDCLTALRDLCPLIDRINGSTAGSGQ